MSSQQYILGQVPSESLGKLLRGLWESRGFSLRGFARESGLSKETLRLYGSGARKPSNKSVLKILGSLGIDKSSEEAQAVESCGSNVRNQDISDFLREGSESRNLERRLDLLTDLFFEHSNRERTEALEYFIREKFKEVEKSLK